MEFQQDELLLPALEQAIDAVVLVDEDDCVHFFNAAAERLWGYDRTEVLGKNVTFLVPCGIRESYGQFIEANPNGDASKIVGISRELIFKHKNGEEICASFSLSKIDASGKIYYMAFIRDVSWEVSHRKKIHLLSLAVNETDGAVLVLDQNRQIIYVNRAFSDIFGYEPEEAMGKVPSYLLSGEATNPETLANLRRQVWGKRSFTEEILLYDRHGKAIWVSETISPICDAQGDVVNLVVVFTDITSLKLIQSLQDDVLEMLTGNSSLPEVADFICRKVEERAPDIVSSIVLVDEEHKLRPLAAPSMPPEFSQSANGLPIGEAVGSCGTAIWRGEPVFVTDISTDPLWEPYKHLALSYGFRACWSFPIKRRDGRVAGSFAFYYRELRGPSPFHLQAVKACLHLCRLAIERDEANRRIALLSSYDVLTGLPNRPRFLEEIDSLFMRLGTKASTRPDSEYAIDQEKIVFLAIGLDRFTDVNNSFGHSAGDRVLVEAAYRLQTALAGFGAIIGRIGGDSFIVALPNCDETQVSFRAHRILQAISQPSDRPSVSVSMSASIGVSIYPHNGSDAETLLMRADTAKNLAHEAGGDSYRFFSPEMNQFATDRLVLGSALRNAIASNQLQLHYQPQIDLRSKKLYGVEALARWHDPTYGEVSPNRFIPLAEEIGLIENIGKWSLREACIQMATWRSAGFAIPAMSVNLSPTNFHDCGLPGFIGGLLREYGLPPDCLIIEITENVMMDAGRETLRTLAALHELGIGLSMDDFGTGFSSLSNLLQMPFDAIKLDRSFMSNLGTDRGARAVTTAIVRIGQSLGMTVVAEGVETMDQLQLLGNLDCSVVQGYYFARAMASGDLERWVSNAQFDSAIPSGE